MSDVFEELQKKGGDDWGADAEEMGYEFSSLLVEHHRAILDGDDQDAKNAVVVKTVALIALAFGIPAVRDEPLDIPEALSKLTAALGVLKMKGLE